MYVLPTKSKRIRGLKERYAYKWQQLFFMIALCCGICALDFLFALFFHPSITFGFCAAILFFGCLCALVLAGVFAQSVQYKEENDLTI